MLETVKNPLLALVPNAAISGLQLTLVITAWLLAVYCYSSPCQTPYHSLILIHDIKIKNNYRLKYKTKSLPKLGIESQAFFWMRRLHKHLKYAYLLATVQSNPNTVQPTGFAETLVKISLQKMGNLTLISTAEIKKK